MLETIPGPPAYPIIGNLLDIRHEVPILGLANLADKYGPIYKFALRMRHSELVVLSSCESVGEVCDDTRFMKVPPPGLKKNARPGPSGLFTAEENDPDWGQAHRVLMPAFGPLQIGDMFDGMPSSRISNHDSS